MLFLLANRGAWREPGQPEVRAHTGLPPFRTSNWRYRKTDLRQTEKGLWRAYFPEPTVPVQRSVISVNVLRSGGTYAHFRSLGGHMCTSLNQLMRIALLLTAIDAGWVLFPVTAHAGSVLVDIDKTNQQMTVSLNGVPKYQWRVSTGRAGYSTPSGTFTATSMNKIWYSKQWENAPMPHSIFFIRDGHAIHGSYDIKNLGKPVSHGCVRISPENAATLYKLVEANGLENTQVVLTGVSPGGEYDEVARTQTSPRGRYSGRPSNDPYYNESQGYYGSPWSYSHW